ncbi:MAG: zinc ABC transporter substrate-binding protein [Parabacteroides sp.]|nr:zinc ABC transporter substrate-binding protein [Parabacteroides sp.]
MELMALLLCMACGGKQTEESIVTVTIEPQRFFAEKIAGDKFQIHCIVPSGQSPETYDPTPKQMVEVGNSVAYFQIGSLGFEQVWMQKIRENNPDLKIYDLSKGMSFIQEVVHHHHHHSHAHGVDPHIWSSIAGAKIIAQNMLEAFIQLDGEHADYYKSNYTALLKEINQTDTVIRQLLAPLKERTFIIYHPTLTYFAKEFDLTQLCIEMDGKEPSPAILAQLIATAKEREVKVVFIQQEFDKKNAELIAKETDCRLEVINPLSYHWNEELIHIAKVLANGEIN